MWLVTVQRGQSRHSLGFDLTCLEDYVFTLPFLSQLTPVCAPSHTHTLSLSDITLFILIERNVIF